MKRLLTLALRRCSLSQETAYFVRMLRLNGHQNVTFYELDGLDHGDMADPAHLLLLKYIRKDK